MLDHVGLNVKGHAASRAFYGAFVLDADGNNLEAVCHRPA
jgi:hypothetical protein